MTSYVFSYPRVLIFKCYKELRETPRDTPGFAQLWSQQELFRAVPDLLLIEDGLASFNYLLKIRLGVNQREGVYSSVHTQEHSQGGFTLKAWESARQSQVK